MKVLLIAANVAKSPYPVYPLGMGMISSALRKAGHDVTEFDFLTNEMSLDTLSESTKRLNPGIIGISIRNIDNVNMTHEQRYIHVVKDIVAAVRKTSDAKIVLGGSGFSILPETILKVCDADYGFTGEGEVTFTRFVNNADDGVYPEERIIAPDEPKLIGSQIPSASYNSEIMQYYVKNGSLPSIQTKRGCGHKCIYCTYPFLEGTKTRARNPEEVVNDIETLINKYNAETVFFTDSIFNDDGGQYIELLKTMKKRGVNTPWIAFFRPEQFDESTIKLMKDTGLKAVELGSDASTDATLKELGKSFRFEDIRVCNDLLASHDISVAHYYMFGCPGETEETVLEGIQNIISLKQCVSFMFMGIRILPGTALRATAVADGIITPDQDLLESSYYVAPGLDHAWLEKTLTDGFKAHRRCIFPPDAMENQVQFLLKMGYTGILWDRLINKVPAEK